MWKLEARRSEIVELVEVKALRMLAFQLGTFEMTDAAASTSFVAWCSVQRHQRRHRTLLQLQHHDHLPLTSYLHAACRLIITPSSFMNRNSMLSCSITVWRKLFPESFLCHGTAITAANGTLCRRPGGAANGATAFPSIALERTLYVRVLEDIGVDRRC